MAGGSGRSQGTFCLAAAHSFADRLLMKVLRKCLDTRARCSRSMGIMCVTICQRTSSVDNLLMRRYTDNEKHFDR